ncbi:MAG TPA: PAS domain S-box protein, partial [Blastocatellia bacterium]|nr:PAS domain S-box protein [Blastocatellia bacterium]
MPQSFGVWRHRRKNGTIFYVEITSYSLTLFGRQVRVSVCNDVTESQRHAIEFEVLSEIIQGVNLTSNLDELLQLIHRSLKQAVYAENFFVTLYDEETGLFNFPFHVDKYDSAPKPAALWKTCTGYVLRTGKPLLLTEQIDRELTEKMEIEMVGTRSRSWLGIPLRTPSRSIGVLVLQHYEEENAFTQRDVEFLESVAGQIALAIERKAAETALRETNQTLNEVIQSSPLAIATFSLDGRVRLWNSAAERIFGWTAEEITAIPFPLFPDLSNEDQEKHKRDILSGERISNREMQRLTKDGSLINVSMSLARLCDAEGEPSAILALIADISERKNAEAALRLTEEQLRQAQKMEAVGQLAGGVAHDFNNLLTAILGYSETMLAREDIDESVTNGLREITKAGHRASSLTGQLLAFSRKQVLMPKVVDLNSIVEDIDKMLRRLIGEDVSLTTTLQPDVHPVKVDPGQIEQVLLNLAVNARDAMPHGGDLMIETSNAELDENYLKQHAGVSPGRYVCLSVSDSGMGMDAETQSRIFEPFFTTKEIGKGTGLGLSTVYGIVKQSGGHVWVYSEVGIGTTFKIYFPRFEEQRAPQSSTTTEREGGETILLVEDEEVVRTMVSTLLTEMGYKILCASTSDEAEQISGEFTSQIDLLLSDIVMPQINGAELAKKLIQSRPNLKIIFMSGHTGLAVDNLAVAGVVRPFLQKPFSLSSLATSIREIMDGVQKS